MDYKYYIEKAGGLGEYAQDEDEIMIIKGDTKEWISPSEHKSQYRRRRLYLRTA